MVCVNFDSGMRSSVIRFAGFAVITGDIVFDHVYFGVPRDQARQNWQTTIDQNAALNPAVVIPGHEALARRAILVDYLLGAVSAAIGRDTAGVEDAQRLADIGVDSLATIGLTSRISYELGVADR